VFFIRPLTLAIRLFANMMAGHVLLTVFFLFTEELLFGKAIGVPLGFITFAVACGLILFELMIMSIQAYIFTVLSAFYIAEALHGHGDEPEHATHGPETDQPEVHTKEYETELQPA
jgi:F-type H+-transporting ATPase subunit a